MTKTAVSSKAIRDKSGSTTITHHIVEVKKVKDYIIIDDRVIVKPDDALERTASGIYIPQQAQERPMKGTVLVIGQPNKDTPFLIKPGDRVMYGKYGGTEFEEEGETYLIMRRADIYCII